VAPFAGQAFLDLLEARLEARAASLLPNGNSAVIWLRRSLSTIEIKNTLVPSKLLLSPFPTPFRGHQEPVGQGRAQKTRSGGIEHLRNLGIPIFLVRTRRADITWIFWLLFFFWCRDRRALLVLLLLFDVVLRGRLVSRLARCP
jgi:hypothetical protein